MVKVVPTEEGAEVSLSQQGKEAQQPGIDVDTEQPTTEDDPAEVQPTTSTTAGASAEEEDQRLDSTISDGANTESGEEMSPPRSGDPSRKPPESEEMHHEVQQLESGALATVGGSDVVGSDMKDVAPALDMDKHSGMTTFSLMRHDDESSLGEPDAGLTPHIEEGDEANDLETLKEGEEGDEEGDSEFAPRLARQNTGATRKFVRQNTGIGVAGGASTGRRKKKAPFRVPQMMFMGHPVGSPAAEFLERQQHRLAEIKTRREEVAGLLELVMEHNPKTTGSSLPDIDAVFPDKWGREPSQGDYCV